MSIAVSTHMPTQGHNKGGYSDYTIIISHNSAFVKYFLKIF